VIENYKRSSAESLSLPFLLIWLAGELQFIHYVPISLRIVVNPRSLRFLPHSNILLFSGDISNLVGCILTDQLRFQKYLGIYFVSIDFTLLAQWIYYTHIAAPVNVVALEEESQSAYYYPNLEYQNKTNFTGPVTIPRNYNHLAANGEEQNPLLIISDESLSPPYSASASPSKWYTLGEMEPRRSASPRIILSAIFMLSLRTKDALVLTSNVAPTTFGIDQLLVGRIFAWLCAALYLASRLPQIFKNLQRKSVDGLSSALFIFAALGNLTYTASILLSSAMNYHQKVIEAIPYLLGSIGTLVFDVIIFSQFFWYRRKTIMNPIIA
jgi:uncharacterized protein with PQ loop repeat